MTPLASATQVRIGLTLGFTHGSELTALLAGLTDPRSPSYRKFLTFPEFEQRFGPSAAAVGTVESALRTTGATDIVLRPGSSTVEATVTSAGLERLLGVRPVTYLAPGGGREYTVEGTVALPPSLAGWVTGVDGLSGPAGGGAGLHLAQLGGPAQPRSDLAAQFVVEKATGQEWFLGSDYTQAYLASALLPGSAGSVPHAGYPYHVAIATLLASSYNQSFGSDLPPFDPAVVDKYFADTLAPGWPTSNLTGVPVTEPGTPDPPYPGSFGPYNDSIGMETENSLDLEMAGSLAPGAPLFNFYFSGRLVASPVVLLSSIAGYLADDLARALAYPSYGANVQLGVVSCSFGLPDLNSSAWDSELVTAAAMGVTVVSASGDQGNAPSTATGRTEGPDPVWPATAAFNTSGVVAIGGVSSNLVGTQSGNYTGPPLVAGYDPQVQGLGPTGAWFDTSQGFGDWAGSEGGVSGVYAEPYWQFHSAAQPNIVTEAEIQGVSSLGRAGPDLAFPANNTIAYISESPSHAIEFGLISGTSVAAPVFAGLVADVVGVESATVGAFSPLGYLAPELYRLASYFAANPGPADPFLDVTTGGNALFTTLPGWDAVTGWGGLRAPLFLQADENPTARSYVYNGSTPTLPPRPGPAFPYGTVFVVVGGVAVAAVVLAVVLLGSRKPAAPPPADIFDAYVLPQTYGGPAPVTPPTFSTFSCPFCGAERPAEAGRCPSCGAL